MIAQATPEAPHLVLLTTRIHRQIVEAMDLAKAAQLSEDELRQQLEALAVHLCAKSDVELAGDEKDDLVQRIMDEIYGLGPLQPLMQDPEVTEILVTGANTVRAERAGRVETTSVTFANEDHLLQFIHRTVAKFGRRIDESSPIAEVQLEDGSIFSAVLPPLAINGPTLSIRRLADRRLKLEDMVRVGSLAPQMADFLVAAIANRCNIVFSGGSGAGKTTLLNNVSRFVPDGQRIVTIEETAELRLQNPDVISLQTRLPNVEGRGAVTASDLVRHAVRMRPDRLIVGQLRGGEVFDMLQAMNTGHRGSMGTVHANDAGDALEQMELMASLSGEDRSTDGIRRYIAKAVDFVVHVARLSTGERKVTRVSELRGLYDGSYAFEDIFVYRGSGVDDSFKAAGSFFATGYEPLSLKTGVGTLLTAKQYREMFIPRELSTGNTYEPIEPSN